MCSNVLLLGSKGSTVIFIAGETMWSLYNVSYMSACLQSSSNTNPRILYLLYMYYTLSKEMTVKRTLLISISRNSQEWTGITCWFMESTSYDIAVCTCTHHVCYGHFLKAPLLAAIMNRRHISSLVLLTSAYVLF